MGIVKDHLGIVSSDRLQRKKLQEGDLNRLSSVLFLKYAHKGSDNHAVTVSKSAKKSAGEKHEPTRFFANAKTFGFHPGRGEMFIVRGSNPLRRRSEERNVLEC